MAGGALEKMAPSMKETEDDGGGGASPAVLPNLTCRAEKGTSQRNRTGSESPWESAERALVWEERGGGGSSQRRRFRSERENNAAFTVFFFSLLFSLQTKIAAFLKTGERKHSGVLARRADAPQGASKP